MQAKEQYRWVWKKKKKRLHTFHTSFRSRECYTAVVCDFQSCKGEEETGSCGVWVPGESVLGGSQTSGEKTQADIDHTPNIHAGRSFSYEWSGSRRGSLEINDSPPPYFPGFLIISTHDASLPVHVQSEKKGTADEYFTLCRRKKCHHLHLVLAAWESEFHRVLREKLKVWSETQDPPVSFHNLLN